MPFISICIPAYRRVVFLKRLLHSIALQSFRDFEVIVTDDSPGDEVAKLCREFPELNLKYFKNQRTFGTPANWNEAIRQAKGEWIKLMHDDDWFASEEALEIFSRRTKGNCKFIFSAYSSVFPGDRKQEIFFPSSWRKRIIRNPVTLLSRNVIGPPSVTLIHKTVAEKYNELLKWRVDTELYMRILKLEHDFDYINEPIINIGIDSSQVTNSCINKPEVELPEGLVLLNEYGTTPLRNILIYDAWWRILRNVKVRSKGQLLGYAPSDTWPKVIFRMLRHQTLLPHSLLKLGVISKVAMTISYLVNRK